MLVMYVPQSQHQWKAAETAVFRKHEFGCNAFNFLERVKSDCFDYKNLGRMTLGCTLLVENVFSIMLILTLVNP